MKITNRVPINLMSKQPTPIVYAVQGDSARAIAFDLYCSGSPWLLPNGARAVVRYKRPDGGCGVYDTLPDGSCACEITEHTVVVAIAQTVLAAVGTVYLQISIEREGEILSTFPIIVRVEEDLAAGVPTPEVYVNILSWTQTEIDKIASELHAELDRHTEILSEELNQHAGKLSDAFNYVAEDDGQGNVTIKPFHLAGLPNFGLGGFFSKVYSFEEADDLKVPGWYLVNVGEGQLAINGETVYGLNLVRVDGADRDGAVCVQIWVGDSARSELRREYSRYRGAWGAFYSINPMHIPGRIYATNEHHELDRVYSVLIDAGTVEPGDTSVKLNIEAPKVFLDIVPYVRAPHPLSDMPGDKQTYTYYGAHPDVTLKVGTSAVLGDTNGNMEVDTITGFEHYLEIRNRTEYALDIRCLLKFADGDLLSW